jgi:glucosamine-6-phosphate deaminase
VKITISKTPGELGLEAARLAAASIRSAIETGGSARIVLATGSSQFETLEALLKENISWNRVDIFHLDEYIGLPSSHKASFRKYLYERFVNHIQCRKFYSIDTDRDTDSLIRELTKEISKAPIDAGMIGIGENGHVAFNDPPADFDTRDSYIVVNLDEQCRNQQVGEGWFSDMSDVPLKAVSMSVWQIMQCRTIISAVPHKVKAEAVRNTLINRVTNQIPATILKQHRDFNLFLDHNSASALFAL